MTNPVFHSGFDGANGATTFADDITGRHTLTGGAGSGGAYSLSNSRPVFGPTALELALTSGSGGGFVTIGGNLTDFDFGAGDFTIEGWGQWDGANPSFGSATIISCHSTSGTTGANGGWMVGVTSGGKLVGRVTIGSTLFSAVSTTAPPATGTSFSWCLQRTGGQLDLFLDGTVIATNATLSTGAVNGFGANNQVRFGVNGGTFNDGWKGMIDEVRITPAALYSTSGYTPSATAFPAICTATGFLATNFGVPQAGHFATGFLATNFGTPQVKMVLPATGFAATHFGTPLARSLQKVTSIGRTTHFGTPSTPTYREGQATGFLATQFGVGAAMVNNPVNGDRTLPVTGFRTYHFGRPTAGGSAACDATGFLSAFFGMPEAVQNQRVVADGIAPATQFGTPIARQVQPVTGFLATNMGTPTTRTVCQATGIAPRTRFGIPTYSRSGGHAVYGWRGIFFGHPTARRGSFRAASGFLATNFGTPTATFRSRVTSIEPATRFGIPLAVRNPRC